MLELTTAPKATKYGILNTLGVSQIWKLGYNAIPHYDVVGLSGVQNLGVGDLGMALSIPVSQAVYSEDLSNFTFHIKITFYELFGGIANDIGVRVITATASNIMQADFLQQSIRLTEGSVSNYAVQMTEISISRPKLILGQAVHFIKFEPLMRRNTAGETRVVGAHMEFKYGV